MRISLIVFALGNFLLPFANQITGPIDDEEMVSGSGMESVSNGSDNGYCVFNYTRDFVNKNSLKRLPASVWAIMILITLMIVLGRYVYTSMFNYCSGVNRFKFVLFTE